MRAHARLAVAADRDGRTRIDRLRSDPPMVLRPTLPVAREPMPGWDVHAAARVSLAASAAGPVGGDKLRIDVDVGPGAALVIRTVAAALALPGPHGRPSGTETTLRVADGATLLWLPEPLIAAEDCDHRAITRVELAPQARLLAREELILGRHGEAPGTTSRRVRVTRSGRPLYDQDTRVGPSIPGWHGPAVTGGRKTLGSALVVDPLREGESEASHVDGDTVVLPVAPSATLVSVLADDAVSLRSRLDERLAGVDASRTSTSGSSPCAASAVAE